VRSARPAVRAVLYWARTATGDAAVSSARPVSAAIGPGTVPAVAPAARREAIHTVEAGTFPAEAELAAGRRSAAAAISCRRPGIAVRPVRKVRA